MYNTSLPSNVTCNPEISNTSAYFSVVPAIQVLINGVIAIAAYRYRSKLRNNFVYAYVISLMAANVTFGIFSILGLINRGLAVEAIYNPITTHKINHGDPSHQSLKRWWAFRSSFTVCIYLVMSFNVSSLIYGIRESSYFIGPGVRRHRFASDSSNENVVKHKRNRAFFLIAVGWIGPFILSMSAVAGWNCADKCLCFSGYYGSSLFLCQTNIYHECSGLHPPLSQAFLITCAILWFLLTIGILVVFFMTVQKYRQITKPSSKSVYVPQVEISARIKSTSNSISENDFSPNNNESVQEIKPQNTSWKKSVIRCFTFRKYNVTLKLMFIISILFILCASPTIAVIMVDIVSPGGRIDLALVLSAYAVSMVYCIISPLILCYYMSGLRAAVVSLFTTCGTRTVVRKQSIQPNALRSTNFTDSA